MIKFLVGSFIALHLLLLSIYMIGAHPILFFHPAELVAVVLVPIGVLVSSFGFKRTFASLSGIIGIRDVIESERIIVKRWIVATYASGGISLIVGLILTLTYLDQSIMVMGFKTAAAFCAPIYALVIAEVLLRPALFRSASE